MISSRSRSENCTEIAPRSRWLDVCFVEVVATRFSLLGSILFVAGSLLSTSAAASVTKPFPGVQLVRSGNKALIVADLCAPGVSVRATKYGERRATPQTWGAARGLQAAINADFFNFPAATYVLGRARGGGQSWPASAQLKEPHHYFEFGPGFANWVNPANTTPTPGATDIIGSHNPVIIAGAAFNDGALGDNHPRSAVGLNEARTRLYLFASKDSITGAQIAKSMFAMSAEANGGVPDIDVAMNVDGGGSTQMYVQGKGQIITSGRLVANHLGIFAKGSGGSPQCPAAPFTPVQTRSNADIDGDGTADLCARTSAGVICELMRDGKVASEIKGPGWSDANSFSQPQYASTVHFADIDGDGKADVCARAAKNVLCKLSQGTAFANEYVTGPAFSDKSGWASPRYYSTIQFPDVNGDGKADVCARSSAGVACHLSDGTAFPTAFAGPAWSDQAGWYKAAYYSSIQYPDINGDGKADICARAAPGVTCLLSDGSSFLTKVDGPLWADANGWGIAATGSTIRFVDLDGDKKDDICARSPEGIRCALSTGTGFGPEIVGPTWTDANGWNKPEYYRTIQYLDLNGDGRADICGRSPAGIVCEVFEGTGFGAEFAGPDWSDADGWSKPSYYATIGAADVNHDGKDDLCARNADGILCAPSNGSGFDAPTMGPAWTDKSGWTRSVYYSSIHYVGSSTFMPKNDAGDGASDDPAGERGRGGEEDDDSNLEQGCGATKKTTGSGVVVLFLGFVAILAVRRRRR